MAPDGSRMNEGRADWLQFFFRPRSVVMIGASERSAWSNMVFRRFAT